MERTAGILMPVFSLPSLYGIGSLGQSARDFVDFLRRAGQTWWDLRGTETPPIKASLPTPEIRCSLTLTCWRRTDF